MERLTKRFADGTAYTTNYFRTHNGVITTHSGEIVDKLADYEDAEEQGLLLRTSVTAGSVVYALWSVPTEKKYVIYPAQVKEISIKEYGRTGRIEYVLEPIYFRGRHQRFYSDDFGKTVFLTKEEAESALAEKGGAV